MLAQYFAGCGYQLAGGVWQRLTRFGEVSIDELLVIAAGDKADFLRISLLGQRQPESVREFAHRVLTEMSQREKRATQLLLRESEQEISLVLREIRGTLEQPALAIVAELHARVVAGSELVGADLACRHQQLIELQMIVAKAARDRRASRKIF